MRLPNLHVLALKLAGRSTCVMGRSTRLLPSARILNVRGPSSRITLGENTIVAGELMAFRHGGQIVVGDWCFVGPGARIWSGASITIGNRVLIAHNVNIFDNLTHPLDPVARHAQFRAIAQTGHPTEIDLEDSPVVIEDDVWVGAGSTVLKGISIGRAAVIGAGSVVTRDVPAFAVVAGNPARIVRELPHVD